MLEIRLLGQFEVQLDSQRVEIPSRAAQALLAYLVLSAGTSHRREKLAGLFWPDATDSSARSNLRQALWRIRTAIESPPGGQGRFILADEYSLTFDAASAYQLDAARLERKLADNAPVAEWLEAVAAYQGELLPGSYEEWVILERERLQGVFERKMQGLLDRLGQEQQWPAILEWGERWIALGHVPEPAYRALMLAHFQLGDLANVAAVYQRCVKALKNDLGVAPSEQTQNLYERLSKGEASTRSEPARPEVGLSPRADSPASPSPTSNTRAPGLASPLPLEHATQPPTPLTSFIGRAQELEELQALVSGGRQRQDPFGDSSGRQT